MQVQTMWTREGTCSERKSVSVPHRNTFLTPAEARGWQPAKLGAASYQPSDD